MIRLALASLPDACRNLLIALYYEDPQPSYADLARRLGKPIGSLGPTRARCIERVRQILERLAVNDGGIRTGTSRTSPDERSRERRIRRDTRGGAAWPSEYPARANVEE